MSSVSAAGARRARRPWSASPSSGSSPEGFGRYRMALLADASADSLRAFLLDNVEPGATVVTDGWQPYRPATRELYIHNRVRGAAGRQASQLLPGVHMVASLAKQWLLAPIKAPSNERTWPAT
jgi:hypothetical protein